MHTTLSPLPDLREGSASTRRMPRIGLLAVLALVLAAAVSLLTVPAAGPAQAVGNCTASQRAALWEGQFSVRLQRKTNCTYYAKLVIDDPLWGVGAKITVKVERQEKSPYGWFVTETKSKSTYWTDGTWNTGTVEGWYPTAWEGDDNHRACWRLNTASWHCTAWMGI